MRETNTLNQPRTYKRRSTEIILSKPLLVYLHGNSVLGTCSHEYPRTRPPLMINLTPTSSCGIAKGSE